jgi:hypothetical protein
MARASGIAHTDRMKGTSLRFLLCSLALSLLAGCASNRGPDDKPVVTTPNGPCRDDENFDNGHCTPRFPGDGAPRSENSP